MKKILDFKCPLVGPVVGPVPFLEKVIKPLTLGNY
jgi:hypothetical protein